VELEEYRLMFELEETHWWYRGLQNLLFSSIEKIFCKQRKINILDAGCGTGYILQCLNKYGISFGIDISEVALRYCQSRALNRITKASISELPFRDESFDLVVSTDVFYHKAVENDNNAIKEIFRVLKKEGVMIINLPAHNYLKRGHDENVHTKQRYNKEEVYYKLRNNNFKIIKISYRNAFSFPILLFLKLLGNKFHKKKYTNLRAINEPVNSILYGVLKTENALLKSINIPFGVSLFCIAKK